MKMIEAVIDQLKLQEVRFALDEMGIVDFMVTPVLCYGDRQRQVMTFRGASLVANVTQKVKIEIVSADHCTTGIIERIRSIARNGHREGCRIGVLSYQEVC